jgi:long-chain acyl-CoA synthetase
MTEIGCYYAMNPRYGRRKWGSLGLPTPHTEVRLIGDDGRDVGMGAVGEILVRTPSATIGYWRDPVETENLFRDGWLQTGDLGRVDEEGYLWFVGRRKLMIVRRGSNIAPAEVENVLDEHPQVHASVVVGVPDPYDGSVPVAWIMPMPDADAPDEDALRAYVSARLAPYQSPVYYLFSHDLPRNSTGKLDRHRLQELAVEVLGGKANGETSCAAPPE